MISMRMCIFATILLLPVSLVLAAPVEPPRVEGATSLEPPTSSVVLNETGHLRQISAGLQLLNAIAVKRLSGRLQARNVTSQLLVPHYGQEENMTAWNATALMCEQHALLSALWDIPPAHQDSGIIFTKAVTQTLMVSFCKWSEFFLSSTYPSSNISFTCTTHEIEKICQDLQTVSFSSEVQAAIFTHDNMASHTNGTDVNQWVDRHLPSRVFLPEAFQLINSTRNSIISA